MEESYEHVPGRLYRIMDGVRRAKAAMLSGHAHVPVIVIDREGECLGVGDVPIESLNSPKQTIRRITSADETRWMRVEVGANQPMLPFPRIVVQPVTERTTTIDEVSFDFGENP